LIIFIAEKTLSMDVVDTDNRGRLSVERGRGEARVERGRGK